MQNLSSVVSGSNTSQRDASNHFNISGQTIASWRENSLYSRWNYGDDEQFAVSELYAQRAFAGNEYSLGLMSTQGFGFNFYLIRQCLVQGLTVQIIHDKI